MPICFALDVELIMLYHGVRLVETRAGSVITADWVPNFCISDAFDTKKHAFFYANHGYRRYRVDYNMIKAEGEEAITARGYPEPFEDNVDLWRTSTAETRAAWFVENYERLCRQLSIKQPTRLGEPEPLYGIVDELVPKNEQRDLHYSKVRYVARKPQLDAPYATMSPTQPLERSDSRFDLEKFDPRKEKEMTRWKLVDQLEIPSMQCPRCRSCFAEGFLICTCCGLQPNTSTDLRKACQVIRLEELASRLQLRDPGPHSKSPRLSDDPWHINHSQD